MLIDINDWNLDLPLDPPPKKKELQKCVCGAQAIGIQKFMPGHSDWCEVHEDKTPVGG